MGKGHVDPAAEVGRVGVEAAAERGAIELEGPHVGSAARAGARDDVVVAVGIQVACAHMDAAAEER